MTSTSNSIGCTTCTLKARSNWVKYAAHPFGDQYGRKFNKPTTISHWPQSSVNPPRTISYGPTCAKAAAALQIRPIHSCTKVLLT